MPDQPGHIGWQEDAKMFEADTVYFDFDSAAIKASEKAKIETVAAYLKGNSSQAMKIEGHCDQRGTEEYNRALGERRALAVREALVRAGVAPDRIETISYGEDRPADPGNTEAAWKKNRRGVFVLLSPPK
jgi:peptidoglycan-associated lipoprotein